MNTDFVTRFASLQLILVVFAPINHKFKNIIAKSLETFYSIISIFLANPTK